MPRVRIDLPPTFAFQTAVPLYLVHINAGGHLDNGMLLTVVSEARNRFFHWMGGNARGPDGTVLMTADAAVQYLSEAHHGEVMVVEMTAHDFTRCGCDFVWRMSDQATGREVARGKTGMVNVDPDTRRPTDLPAVFRARFA